MVKYCYYVVPDTDIYVCDKLANNLNCGNITILGSIKKYLNFNIKVLPVMFDLDDAVAFAHKLINKLIVDGSGSNMGEDNTLKQYPIFGAIILKLAIEPNVRAVKFKNNLISISKGGIRDYTKIFSHNNDADLSLYKAFTHTNKEVLRGIVHNISMISIKSAKYIFGSGQGGLVSASASVPTPTHSPMPVSIGFGLLNSMSMLKSSHVKLLKQIYDTTINTGSFHNFEYCKAKSNFNLF